MGKKCGCKSKCKCTHCCPTQINNCCPTQTICCPTICPTCTPCPTPTLTPTPPPFSGGTCCPCQTQTFSSECCSEEILPIRGKVTLDCGIEFNNTEFVFGRCAIRFITNTTNPILDHLINIIDIPGEVTSLATVTFRLPEPGTDIPNNCGKKWVCGQILYVSNVSSTSQVLILPPEDELLNGSTTNSVILQAFFGGPPASQSSAQFILAPRVPGGNCHWYTLNI